MIDFAVLEAFGTTNQRLREVFTAQPDPSPGPVKGESKEEKKARIARSNKLKRDIEVRERFRMRDQTRVEEGIVTSLRNWKKYAAVDMAWDSSVISGMTLPLQMYAQGKINVERAATMLCKTEGGKEFVKKNEAGKMEVDVPRFIESNVNLIRSIITRRHGAQKNKFNQLWPYYKYEPRSTGVVAKCRADVLSQRVDMMVDQFGYRHHDSQVMLDGFLYADTVDFVRQSWEVEKQYVRKSVDGDPKDVDAVITKEGVGFFTPHRSRLYWDNAYPLSSLNTDSGCEWVGFWDVQRFSEIDDNPYYFNKQSVGWTGRFWGDAGVYNTYKDYFTHYQYTIIPPNTGEVNPATMNDRTATVGFYSGNQRDASVFTSNTFEKIVPKDWGIGEYPWPVWIRKVTASDSTVIFAEIMPSTPGAYLGINVRDSRQVNVSMAMDLFSYQDQMTNLLTHLMLVCQIELFKAIGINTDCLSPEQVKAVRTQLAGRNWFSEPLIYEYSLAKMQELGFNVEKVIQIAETNQGATINSIFEAIIKLADFTERQMAMSPAEQGQPAPREISATEVSEISNTTSSVYSSISEDIDEFRGAKKRIVYESLVACSKGNVICPVKDRYTEKTIIAAGFKPKAGEDEDFGGSARRRTVIGTPRALVHDYIFTSRDGSERPVNTQAANTLVQMLGIILGSPIFVQAAGKEKIYEIMNEIFRLSGAGLDLNLTLKEGEDNSMGVDEIAQLKQTLDEVAKYLQQLAGQVQKTATEVQAQEQVNQEQQDAIQGLLGVAKQVQKMAGDVSELNGKHQEISKRLTESMPYDKVPESIKRQMEAQAGFIPAHGEISPQEKIAKLKQPTPQPTKKAA